MRNAVLILLMILAPVLLRGQNNAARTDYVFGDTSLFSHSRLPINSDASDFGVAVIGNTYLFSSARNNRQMISYTTPEGKQLFDLYCFERNGSDYSKAKLFATELRSSGNECSATASKDGTILIYTANRSTNKYEGSGNTLALFESVRTGKRWSEPRILSFCSAEANYEQAFLVWDSILYFVSDRKDGAGGKDIWISRKSNGDWSAPVNAGKEINSPSNETFPFISSNGTFYFSSDRAGGKGGLDIYQYRAGEFKPVALPGAINSQADDFAFTIDDETLQGYFSSNRGEDPTDDNIYSFTIDWKQTPNPDTLRPHVLCYTFTEEASSATNDTALMKYTWTFGPGINGYGYEVIHCFDSIGSYPVHLEVRDSSAGDLVISKVDYEFVIASPNFVDFISPDTVRAGDTFEIDAHRSAVHGFTITQVRYDFGSGYRAQGSRATHTYYTSGKVYPVIHFTLRNNDTGEIVIRSITKPMIVL